MKRIEVNIFLRLVLLITRSVTNLLYQIAKSNKFFLGIHL
jgi:hypothetical protein